jgi:hypothetical protein
MNAKVHVVHDSNTGYDGKATRRKCVCIASFDSCDDLFLKRWLGSYCGADTDKDRFGDGLLNNPNYARAIVGSYFGGTAKVLWVEFESFVPDDALPASEPTQKNEKYKLWIITDSKEEVETAESVARSIFEECRRGKITMHAARVIFNDRGKGGGFLFEDVLAEFDKLGGAHTDQYCRHCR